MTDTIAIGGREFRVGATYAPKSGKGKPRILMIAWQKFAEVEWRDELGAYWGRCRYDTWLRWAGEEVVL
jgi:hypothetical protein